MGTLDVSLLNIEDGIFEVKATAGDTHLGGEDIDNRIVEYVKTEFMKKSKLDISGNPRALRRLRTACERVKKQLSSSSTATVEVDGLYEGVDCCVQITRAKFEQLCMDIFRKTLEPVRRVLEDAKVDKSQVDDIVLVGGSTRICKIQEMLKEFFNGKELCKSVHPDEAVAYGAAIQAAILTASKEERNDEVIGNVVLLDVTPLTLGIETAGEIMTPMIKRNSSIPCRKEQEFSTAVDNQPAATICVYEGERPLARDNRLLGKFDLKGIPPAPRGQPKIKIIYDVDVNSVLTVTAEVEGVGKKETLRIDSSQRGTLSKEEIEKMIKEAEINREHDEKVRRRVESKNKLDSFLYQVESFSRESKSLGEDDKKTIMDKVTEYKEWFDSHPEESAETYDQKYEDFNNFYKEYASKMYSQASGSTQAEPTQAEPEYEVD